MTHPKMMEIATGMQTQQTQQQQHTQIQKSALSACGAGRAARSADVRVRWDFGRENSSKNGTLTGRTYRRYEFLLVRQRRVA